MQWLVLSNAHFHLGVNVRWTRLNLEKTSKNEIIFPSRNEIEIFAQKAVQYLENVSFRVKKEIIRIVLSRVTASRTSLQTYGFFNLNEIYVLFLSINRNRWLAKRR
jgi:hypothetical protein